MLTPFVNLAVLISIIVDATAGLYDDKITKEIAQTSAAQSLKNKQTNILL